MNMTQVAIITGASGGMGRAIAWLLVHGQRLVLNDIFSESLESLAQSLRDEGGAVDTLAGDLSQQGVA
jgi:NAD(P)-dependent dehydrogenase (short-subunit alcohol dehydrogenase family)